VLASEVGCLAWAVVHEGFDSDEVLINDLAEAHFFGQEFVHQGVVVFIEPRFSWPSGSQKQMTTLITHRTGGQLVELIAALGVGEQE